MYKTAVSSPAAFQAAADDRALDSIGRHVRPRLHEHKVLPSMLTLTQRLLTGSFDTADDGSDLLLDDTGFVPGHINWALA